MKVPLAWLRDYVDLPADTQKIAEMLAQIGFPVDGIEERPIVTGVVVGRIAELRKHPNADRLQVGTIETGNGKPLTIATAATNVAQGQVIPVATIGAQLPHLKIEPRKMRGLESEGMMVSADELALPADWFEDGIMQLDPDTPLGSDVVEMFRLSEAVLDVEITSNRVDAMSVIGLARELAAYQGVELRLPQMSYLSEAVEETPPKVTIESPDCARFVAQRFTNVRVGAAPAWMRIRLALAGQRPINNIVDISNYVMLETGQPLHFYDDAKIPGHHLIVRDAREKEKLVTLDDVEHELTQQALVIASEEGAQGLAGLKGGKTSEVSPATNAILLESANFRGARIRRMSAQLGFRTEASARHEKTLPIALTDFGASRAAHLLTAAGARAYPPHAFGAAPAEQTPITFDTRDVKRLLGFDLSLEEIREYLDRLGFALEAADATTLLVTPPQWRSDVTLGADLIEEVARMAGYDRIESVIPPVPPHEIGSQAYDLESRIAQTLATLRYREIVSYALHGADLFETLKRAGVEPTSPSVEIRNPLSEDQRYLRSALEPTMLKYLARVNQPLRAFEIGHVFAQEERRPQETTAIAFGFTAEPLEEPEWRDTHFLQIKADCEALLRALTGRRDFEIVACSRIGLHPGKTAAVLLDGREIACVGRVDPRAQKAFELRLPAYLGSINLQNIPEYVIPRYVPPSKYPSTYRDLALLCDLDVSAASIERCIRGAIGPLCTAARAFDEYRGPQVGEGKKSLAVRVTLQKADTTITDEEADEAVTVALRSLREAFGVVLRE